MVWLLAAVAMLFITLLRSEMALNERAALSGLVPLYFLCFPLGHLGVMALSKLKVDLYVSFNIVPDIFSEGLVLWALLVILGYVQWFLLLPWLARRSRKLTDFLFNRHSAR